MQQIYSLGFLEITNVIQSVFMGHEPNLIDSS